MPFSTRLAALLLLATMATGCDSGSDSGYGLLAFSGSLVGERVALDGDVAMLGAPGSNEVSFFDRTQGMWSRPVVRRPTAARIADPFYGQFVALDGDVAVAGAPESSVADDAPGHAYVYTRSGGAWTEAAVLRPADLTPNAGFGFEVAVSEGRVAIAAGRDGCVTLETRQCGRVHVFDQRSGWARTAVIESPPDAAFFGGNVALDGNRLAVTAQGGEFGQDGILYLYAFDGALWQLEDTVVAPPLPESARFTPLAFGVDLSISGETVAVSEPGRGGGTVYLYRRRGATEWTLDATLSRPRGSLGALAVFGSRIDVDADRLVASAAGRKVGGKSLGAAFVYARRADGTWAEEAELRSDEGVVGFGRDVAISGDDVLIGANDTESRGGGFLFTRGAAGWTAAQ